MDNVMNQFVLPSMIIQIVYHIRVNESQLTEVQFSLHRKSGAFYKVVHWCVSIASVGAVDAVVIEDDAMIIQLASKTTETHPDSAQVHKCATHSGLVKWIRFAL